MAAVDFQLPALQTPVTQTPEQNAQALALIENSRSLAEQRQAQAEQRQQQAAAAAQVSSTRSAWQAAMQASQGDPDAAAEALDKVNPDAAAYGREQTNTARTKALKVATDTADLHGKIVGQTADLLNSINTQDPNDYAAKVLAVRGMAGNDKNMQQFLQTTLPMPGEQGFDPSQIPQYVQRAQNAAIPYKDYWDKMQASVTAANNGDAVKSLAYALDAEKNGSPQDLLKTIASHRALGMKSDVAQPFVDAITSGAYKADPLFFAKLGGITNPEQAATMTGTIPGTTTPTEAAKTKAFEDQTARLTATRPIDVGMGGTLMSPTGQVLGTSATGVPGATGGTGLPQAEPPGTRHPEALANLPTGQAEIAKQIGDYQFPLPSGMALRTPYWQNLIEMATRYNPNLDVSNYAIRQSAIKSFKAGKDSDNIKALNTAIAHLDSLSKDVPALSNFGGPFTLANAPKNWFESSVMGQPQQGAFNTDAGAVASELTNVFRGTGGAESDVTNWRSNLNPNDSPTQQVTNIQHAVALMGGRLNALKTKYEEATGEPLNYKILSPESAAILDRIAPGVIDTSAFTGGKTAVSVPPQVLAAGPGRHTFKNGQVWDVSPDGKSAVQVKSGG